MKRTLTALATLVAAAGLLATPAQAQQHDTGHLAVVAYVASQGTVVQTLTCGPDGGTHPDPRTACRTLDRVDGQIPAIVERPGACTLELDPVYVQSYGQWNGQRIAHAGRYSNPCEAERKTRGVYDFTPHN